MTVVFCIRDGAGFFLDLNKNGSTTNDLIG